MSRKESVQNYACEAIDGIRPISKVDVEIISLLQKAIKDNSLRRIIKGWKVDIDSNIIDQLNQYLDDSEIDQMENESLDKDQHFFITIKDETLGVFMINKIKKVDLYDDDLGEVYSILLNEEPIPDKSNWLKDKYIIFESEEERDKSLRELKNKLSEFTNIIFL